jgi:hypothetical protein
VPCTAPAQQTRACARGRRAPRQGACPGALPGRSTTGSGRRRPPRFACARDGERYPAGPLRWSLQAKRRRWYRRRGGSVTRGQLYARGSGEQRPLVAGAWTGRHRHRALRDRRLMVRPRASNPKTGVRFTSVAQRRRSRMVRHDVANVSQAGSIPVACSTTSTPSGECELQPRSGRCDSGRRLHARVRAEPGGGLLNRLALGPTPSSRAISRSCRMQARPSEGRRGGSDSRSRG